jgi:hypothetical protein
MFCEIRVAPKGNRIGLATATYGESSIYIVILPKHWRQGPAVRYRLPDVLSPQLLVTVHEGDRLAFPAGSPIEALIAALLEAHSESNLFELSYAKSLPEQLAPSDVAGALDLFSFLDEALTPPDNSYFPISALGGASELFARRRFLDSTAPLIRRLHQGYVELTDRVSPLRGRIDAGDLAAARLEKRTHVKCHFDELTPAIPVFRVIVTALHVSSLNPGMVGSILDRALGGVRAEAIRLSKQLRDLRGYSIEDGVRVAQSIMPSSVKPLWREAFLTATQVLHFAKDTLAAGETHARLDNLLIRTEDVWEQLLGRAALLRWGKEAVFQSKPGRLAAGLIVPAPWKKTDSFIAAGLEPRWRASMDSYPDLMVATNGYLWCADAKYKRYEGSNDRGDQYQMFAYSHLAILAESGQTTTRCALLYPAEVGQTLGLQTKFIRQGAEGKPVPLEVFTLPWPSRSDLRTGLDSYLAKLAVSLPTLGTNP